MADDGDGAQPTFGGMLSEKIMDGIKNMDLTSVLQKIVASTPENDDQEEARAKLEDVLKKFTSMSPEEKEHFTRQMKDTIASRMSAKLQDKFEGLEESIGNEIMYRLFLAGAVVLFVIVLLVFFGYRLYKSIKDKEIKREEKRKAKMMKKKK